MKLRDFGHTGGVSRLQINCEKTKSLKISAKRNKRFKMNEIDIKE